MSLVALISVIYSSIPSRIVVQWTAVNSSRNFRIERYNVANTRLSFLFKLNNFDNDSSRGIVLHDR